MIRYLFDFEGFVRSLGDLPASEMAARTLRELSRVHGEHSREARTEFERALYGRKLSRLLEFLRERRLPDDLMPKERAAYQFLTEHLCATAGLTRRQPALAAL